MPRQSSCWQSSAVPNRSWSASLAPLLIICLALMSSCRSRFTPVSTVESLAFGQPLTLNMAINSAELLKLATGLALAEVRRIEETLDPVNTAGSLYQLNQTHTSDDQELYQLLEQALVVSELTGGGLNLFMGHLERAYGFFRIAPQPPRESLIREIMLPIQRAKINLSPERSRVEIPNDAYAVSLTGIQEGYTADQALAMLELSGIREAAVQLGANLACAGSPDGLGWEHAITNPATGAVLVRLFLENCGLATASILDQAYTYRDLSYYNHLDSRTGRLADSLLSVTVIAPSTELAAALARGIFPIGPVRGMQLLNELPAVDGLLLDQAGRVLVSDSLFIWIGG